MSGYTKLYKSLITSTIWQEDNATRILWITMLAMSEMDGTVEGSIPGMARLAGVTIPECKDAIKVLTSPDEYSRTKDHEGRRIKEIDGGWIILNRDKYRDKHESRAEYYRNYRAKQKEEREWNTTTVAQQDSNSVQQNNTQKEKEEELKEDKYKELFDTFRKKYPAKKRGLNTEFYNFKKKHKDWKEVLPLLIPSLEQQISIRDNTPRATFIPEWKQLVTWINNRCWEEESGGDVNIGKTEDFSEQTKTEVAGMKIPKYPSPKQEPNDDVPF